MLQELDVVSAFGRIFTLEKDVRVSIDEARQDCNLRPEVDYHGAGRWGAPILDIFDLVSAKGDQNVVARLIGDAVDQVGSADDRDFLRRRGRLLCEARHEQARQNSMQNGSAAYHLTIPPLSERNMNTLLKSK